MRHLSRTYRLDAGRVGESIATVLYCCALLSLCNANAATASLRYYRGVPSNVLLYHFKLCRCCTAIGDIALRLVLVS